MLNRNKGLFGSAPPPPPAQPEQQRPSFFGHNGTGRNIAGSIGDALLQMNGMRPQFAPARQQQQIMDFQTRQGKTERESRMQDWYAQQDYARANPQAPEPTALQRNYEYLSRINPDIAQDYLASQARDPMDEYVHMPIPGRGTYVGPRSGMAQAMGGSGAPTAPVGRLTPIEPTTQNTPSPQLGASGHPSVISRQQYDVMVRESTPSAVDAYLARRGIQVRN